jgi:hypothetical protein
MTPATPALGHAPRGGTMTSKKGGKQTRRSLSTIHASAAGLDV